jgi:hypothetical protein
METEMSTGEAPATAVPEHELPAAMRRIAT